MAEGVASMVAVPMIVGGRVVGVIELSSPRPYVLPEGAVAVVETLASQAGTAVEAARLHQRTEELSQIDALTRLFNRRRLGTDLEAEWKSSRRYLRPLSFCMFDVDHFKQFNDRHGHRSGDAVLEEVARLVAGAIRGSDSAYRYGGEEFALLLRDTPLDAATALCERLRVRVAERYREEADGFVITASFGVAQAHDAMLGPQELVEIADGALYDAKRAGRDRVVAVRREEQLDASS
jgi:diguanylate cyclase (GGDEF)-like protein